MKHVNHRIVSAGIATISGAGPVGILGAVAGSVLPDFDIPMRIPHRTLTHWWPLYAIGFGAPWILSSNPILHTFFMWVLIGAILHILEDSLTVGGIPILNPFGRKFSFGVTRTGGLLEYVISLEVVGVIVFLAMTDPVFVGHFKGGLVKTSNEIRQIINSL